jgi:hypothetical protein
MKLVDSYGRKIDYLRISITAYPSPITATSNAITVHRSPVAAIFPVLKFSLTKRYGESRKQPRIPALPKSGSPVANRWLEKDW